jgi:hypothetical protein
MSRAAATATQLAELETLHLQPETAVRAMLDGLAGYICQ